MGGEKGPGPGGLNAVAEGPGGEPNAGRFPRPGPSEKVMGGRACDQMAARDVPRKGRERGRPRGQADRLLRASQSSHSGPEASVARFGAVVMVLLRDFVRGRVRFPA